MCSPTMTLQQQFLTLLRAGLYRDCPDVQPSIPADVAIDWGGILRCAQQQAVLPLVYEGMMCLPEAQRPQGADKQQWLAVVLRVELVNKRMLQRMQSLWQEYATAGVRGVLLKGASVGQYYPNPYRRMSGDIDVLFPQEGDAAKIDKHIMALGITPEFDVMYFKHSEFQWHEFVVEHHYYLQEFQHEGYRKFVDGLVQQELQKLPRTYATLAEGVEVEVLPTDFNLFFQLLHITSHLVQSGIGLRQFCDVARFIHVHKGQFDRATLDAWIAQLGMKPAVSAIASILVDWLGVPTEALPFTVVLTEPLVPYVQQDVWQGGNFGSSHLEQIKQQHGRWSYLSWLWASNKRIWLYRRIFPREVTANYLYRIRRVFTRMVRTGHLTKKQV